MSALETGHWKSCWNYNLGNVKAGSTWAGQYTCLSKVREVLDGKERWFDTTGETDGKGGPPIGERYTVPPGDPRTRFRAFGSLAEGCRAWCEKLAKGYRGPLEDLLAGASTDDFVAGLKNLRYFTADLGNYQSLVRALYAQYSTGLEGEPSAPFPLVR
jgi:hypothetical protein